MDFAKSRLKLDVRVGPNLAMLWVMLKLSRARVGHVGAICQRLFGHVVGFVSQSALPQKHQDFKWVLANYVLSMWGSNARMEHFGPRSGPSWVPWAL